MQKPEVRAAQRQQAMRQNKEKKKAEQAAKKAEKAKVYIHLNIKNIIKIIVKKK